MRFKDGGFGYNNPSEEAFNDIIRSHRKVNMGPFISIGTGGEDPLGAFTGQRRKRDLFFTDNFRDQMTNGMAAIRMPSRTMTAHDNMYHKAHEDGKEIFPYFRFHGGKALGRIGLAEWKNHGISRFPGLSDRSGSKTLDQIKEATKAYLDDPKVQADLHECAKILVDRRRLRIRDASKWDRYASFSYYQCDFDDCKLKQVNTAQELKDHIRRDHRRLVPNEPLDDFIKKYRQVYWVYPNGDSDPATATKSKGKGKSSGHG